MADAVRALTPVLTARLIGPPAGATLRAMRARLPLLPLLFAACATGETLDDGRLRPDPPGADALVTGTPGGNGGATPGAGGRLFFRAGADGFVATAAGTEVRMICAGARPVPDAEGGRVLCVPDSDAQPLALYDLAADVVIETYADWQLSADRPPRLSPDGGKIAVRVIDEGGADAVRVYDDGGNTVAETAAFEVIAFPGPDTVLLDRQQTAVWVLGSEPVTLQGGGAMPVGPDPAGAVYQISAPQPKVLFVDGLGGAPRELGMGSLGGAAGTRVLLEVGNTARVLDVGDPTLDRAVTLPSVGFDRQRGVRFESPEALLSEVQTVSACPGGASQRVSVQTRWHRVIDGEAETVAQTDTGHRAWVDRAGEWALVLDLDACGAPQGTGRVVNVKDDAKSRALDALLAAGESPQAGAVSPDGRFVALALSDGVRVIDLASDYTVRDAARGSAGADIVFR